MSLYAANTSGTGTAGAASSVVASRDMGRVNITIVNDHATQIIYLALATTDNVPPTATVNNGIRLNAAGGSWSSSFKGHIAAIGSGAGTNYTIVTY